MGAEVTGRDGGLAAGIDRRVAHLETSVAGLERGLEAVQKGQEIIFGKIDALANAIHAVHTARPAEWRNNITTVLHLTGLAAAAASAIIWIAGNLYAAQITELRVRLDVQERMIRGELSHSAKAP
jgi:hypothetical protein